MSKVPIRQSVGAGERFPKSRALPRYAITALAELTEPVSKRCVSGWTSLISDNGCHVRAADTLAPGTIIQLRIEREGKSFETWARVADAVAQEGMGLAFFDTSQPQRDLLKTWMAGADAKKEN
ncbi:MAG TPA: PilZ domain-containing protein [Candidatus Acidoferrales bacterium]